MKKEFSPRRLALCLTLCILTIVFCDLALPMREGEVYDSVIRLHVLANSSEQGDQQIKYAVRDVILAEDCFGDAEDINAAKADIENAANRAVNAANAYLEAEGVPYRATYEWGREDYPTRVYEGIKLPSGNYLSLRIVLGEGEGENWWCVLFPPMCFGAAKGNEVLTDGKVFDSKSKKYSFRFKLLEWFS